MPRPMTGQEWNEFEAAVRCYCEIRVQFRIWRAQASPDAHLEARIRATLQELEDNLDALREGDEIARERKRRLSDDSHTPLRRTV